MYVYFAICRFKVDKRKARGGAVSACLGELKTSFRLSIIGHQEFRFKRAYMNGTVVHSNTQPTYAP